MLKVNMELNMVDKENDYCSPTILVSEDNSNEICYIVLPEYTLRVVAFETYKEMRNSMIKNFKTVLEVKEALYG